MSLPQNFISLTHSNDVKVDLRPFKEAPVSDLKMKKWLPLFKKRFYLFIFRERGGREKEKHQCVVASHVPPTGGPVHNPGMSSDWESNLGPFGSQASTQSTEQHHPGLAL